MSGVEDRLRAVLDGAEPHMDGSYTVTLPKYADRPGHVRPLLPHLFLRDIIDAADEIVRLRAEVAGRDARLARCDALVAELRGGCDEVDHDGVLAWVDDMIARHGFTEPEGDR